MDYKRKFIILNREDEEYCGKGATGYCKIETYNGSSHIKVFIQGVKPLDNGQSYRVYLISYNPNNFDAVVLGSISGKNAKSELIVQVDQNNVLSSNLDINKFNIVALYIKDNQTKQIHQYPLVGYDKIEKMDDWKIKLNSKIDLKNSNNIEQKLENKVEHQKPTVKDTIDEFSKIQSAAQVDNNDYYSYLIKGDAEKVSQMMKDVRGISEINPFNRVKLKYKWWKIINMEFFNNIFKGNVIASQIFKHPLIKKKIRENNYCLYGIVSDTTGGIKYIAFGFPSKYSTNDQIYIGGFSVFYPAEGFEKKNGDYGYWVVHIKIDNQNIVMTV